MCYFFGRNVFFFCHGVLLLLQLMSILISPKKNRKGTKEQRTSRNRVYTECIRFENQPWSTSTYTLYVHNIYIYSIFLVFISQVIWSGPGVHHLQKPVNPNLCWVVLCCKNGFMGICQCKHHCRFESTWNPWKDGVTFSWRTEVVGCIVVDSLEILLYNLLTLFAWTNPHQPELSILNPHIHWKIETSFLCRFFSLFICLPGWFPETLTCDFIMLFHKFCSPVLATNYHLVVRLFPFFRFQVLHFYLFIHFIQEEATGLGIRIWLLHGKFINKIWNCMSCLH